jgi:predicted porin
MDTPQAKTGKLIEIYNTEFVPGAVSYSAGDAFQIVQTISNSVYESLDFGIIKAIQIIEYCDSDDTPQVPVINFYFANTEFEGVADNAAFSFDTSDTTKYKYVVGKLTAGAAYEEIPSTNKIRSNFTPLYDANTKIIQPINGKIAYFQMAFNAGYTFTANTKITIKIFMEKL